MKSYLCNGLSNYDIDEMNKKKQSAVEKLKKLSKVMYQSEKKQSQVTTSAKKKSNSQKPVS